MWVLVLYTERTNRGFIHTFKLTRNVALEYDNDIQEVLKNDYKALEKRVLYVNQQWDIVYTIVLGSGG